MSSSKNVDLKPILVYSDPKEIVAYHCIVVPSTMRSPLWKYFGFPANENNEIINKNRIVCGICHAYIAYNKNTTNLSTHLHCKHPEVLAELKANKLKPADCKEFETPIRLMKRDTSPIPSTSALKRAKITQEDFEINWYASEDCSNETKEDSHPTGITAKACIQTKKITYRPKIEKINSRVVIIETEAKPTDDLMIETVEQDNDGQYIETIEYNNIDMNEDGNDIITEELETDSTVASQSKDEFLSEEFLTISEHHEVLYENAQKETVIPSKLPVKLNSSNVKYDKEKLGADDVLQHIKRFVIKDLVSPKMMDGVGFKELITFLSQNADIPTSTEIERSIGRDYSTQHSEALTGIKSVINNRNYSLSFHKLGNSPMIEISVNYWSDIGNRIGSLENQIFCISKNCRNFVQSFADSLERCSAFIVDFDLENEFEGMLPQDIPIIPTFSYVTKLAFEACTQLSVVKNAIDSVDDILIGKIKASHTWLQQFEMLSQFLNDSTNVEHNQIIQVFIECLQPLKNCLDVLAFETSAYASIMKPVALQLINQHYSDISSAAGVSDSDLIVLEKDLKRTIHEIFQKHIIENGFLILASFLDPRFQSLTLPDDSASIRKELEKGLQINEVKPEQKIDEKVLKLKQERGFRLSSLFSNISTSTKSKVPKNRFDIEFRSYTEDVSLDMELCPLEWWSESESLYPTIKQHVKKYFCVPSFVNNFHRLPLREQEELEYKYDRIANETNEKLLWLHLNELRQRSSEA